MEAKDIKAKTDVPAKRERTPITGTRAILEVRGKEPGFHYAWINDDQVDQRRDNGFEHVRHPVQVGGRRLDVSKGPTDQFITRNVGRGVIAYLMRIPLEFYNEDMERLENFTDNKTLAQIGNLQKDGLSGQVEIKGGHVRPYKADFKE